MEGSVIACLYADPLLIAECKLETKDFITQDGVFYFSLAKHLNSLGFNSFDEVTIVSSVNESVENGFVERGGWQTIQHLIDIINLKNWDTYIDKLRRENIILSLHDNGFNLLKPIQDGKKEIIPLKMFRKMDSESVLDWYDAKLSSFGAGYTSKVLEEEEIDFTDEFIEDCAAGLENGVPFDYFDSDINGEPVRCLPFLSNQMSGFLDGTFNMLCGFSSTGKSSLWVTIIMGLIHRGRKVLIISNEQKCKVFKISFIIWLLYKRYKYMGLTRKKLMSGDITPEDRKYIKMVQDYWRETYKGNVKFIAIPDANMGLVKKKIRSNVLGSGYDCVLYDTFKLDFSGDNNDQYYLKLIQDSRDFDAIAKKYNIIVLASLQLANSSLGKLFLSAADLSMSKQIKETCESMLLMRTVYQEELDLENRKFYIRPFRRQKIDGRWVEQDFTADPTAVWRVVFVEKNRNGQDTAGDGVCYLLKFHGEYCVFSESCLCRPRHGHIQ